MTIFLLYFTLLPYTKADVEIKTAPLELQGEKVALNPLAV